MVVTGCSTFNREWRHTANAALGGSHDPVEAMLGRWEGTWKSDANGHHGRLRCIITKKEDGLRARFHATFWKILTFTYAVPLKAEPRDGQAHFSGEANLGWYAGGRYQYEGIASATNFNSTYRCKSDHGIFQMLRPPSGGPG